ncbi:MAG: hypothetical protein ACK55F_22080 [Acidobacteriota bacterium]
MRRLAFFLLMALSAAAQTPATLQVLSDSSQVLVGRTLQFRAVARDAGGNQLQNAVVTWSVNNAIFATINSSGLLTARGLGTLRVVARLGSLVAETAVQTIPSEVRIDPQEADVDVGATRQFSATALDADGNVIPGVAWGWTVTNLRNGTTQTARITPQGVMSAIAEGANMVLATFSYGDVQTGLQRQWQVTARVTTNAPRTYRVRRLFHNMNQQPGEFELRARPSMVWATDDGEVFVNASLGGLTGALLNWREGEWSVVTATGVPRFASASFANELFSHSITRKGQVLTYEDTNINGRQLSSGDRNGVFPVFSNNTPLGATEATGNIFITRNSLASSGAVLVRATFRFENNPVTYTGLFRSYDQRDYELLVSTADRFDPFGTAAFTVDNDFGIAADGAAYYSLSQGANRVWFRHLPDGTRQRVLGVGDAVAGSTVRSFAGGSANAPAFWVDENGELLCAVVLNNNTTHYVHIDRTNQIRSLQLTGQTGILSSHPNHGALLFANPFNNRGNGVYLWKPGSEPQSQFLLSRPALGPTTVEAIESGAINARGEIFLMVRTTTLTMGLVRIGGEPDFLAWSGRMLKVTAPVNLITFIGGAREGAPQLLSGGTTGSVAEWNGQAFDVPLATGERLFGTTMWFGGFHGATYNLRRAPNGDLYFISGVGIGRVVRGGSPELILRFPLRIDTLTVNNPGQFDVNGNGELLFHSSTSAGDNRIFLWSNGQARQLLVLSGTAATATTIDGRIVSSFDSFSLADTGQVLASLRFRNVGVPVLHHWNGQTWTRMAEPNVTRIGTHLVTGIANLTRVGGTRLFAGLNVASGGPILVEWKSGGWEILVNNSSVMPNGQVANAVVATDANRNGDVLFQQSNGNNFLLVRRGEEVRQVINFFRPTPDGDYLIRINAIDFRDDGTVYFLAMTYDDETVLYEAKPI